MKNKRVTGFLALLLTLCLTACSQSEVHNGANTNMTDNTNDYNEPQSLPIADNTLSFADNLLCLTAEDGNRMLSPYSAKMCLALLANGANGDTKQQILNAIGIGDLDAYNTEVKTLLGRYASYEGVMSLETANSLWLNQTIFNGKGKFLTDYQDAMRNFYSAEVREVTSENSIEEVNSWVKKKTNEKIEAILSEDHRNFAAALVNAVYFKANWETAFSKYNTETEGFHNIDGSVSDTDFMHNTDTYGYYEGDGVRAVRIDYGRFGGGEEQKYIRSDKIYSFSMYIMLPDEQEELLNVDAFLKEHAPFEDTRVQLEIPKFEMEYSVSLNDMLKALGMTNAFDSAKADFSAMIDLDTLDDNLVVSDTLQKTYIQVDENGTEAAAVTAITITPTSAVIDDRPIQEFTADKPFYFAIRDNTNGELLFVGRYETVEQ